ncbi:polymorphic toxin-type HINT domain-containing protein [Lentzea sp. BCCO 10_0856]|uniref:Polymorphic toxin-type HINT domain-containing protein n=1 Tax=Lentzea miocenica TaxID=3095431 RepID=A0ABU4T0J5_9PSEU|nr:polymorphic toxin-type HINT domain-containing protein [Lentzea sp. BCCO 10_0856]MDX8031676.1 polymorphic toxin-type HINT domain-containing protein [Lentzea sp. BCCO 10_0856]
MPTARSKRGLVVALAASLASTVLTASPTPAAPYRPPAPQKERVIAGEKAGLRKNEDVRTGTAFTGSAPVWPKASVAEIDLGAVAANKSARVGDTLVSVAAADGAQASVARGKPKIRIETFDREKARASGVDGLLFNVSGGSAKVEVNYSSFRWAYGGDWASRLRLVELPECALRTPDKPECAAKAVPSRNDLAKGTVTATEASSLNGSLMALAAGTSSGSGSFKATSLSSSATWSAGSNTGAFTWNYPLRMPPSLGGPTPLLALEYSSASVDGRMAASNNQPSWIGEGFELGANFIERKYVSCADDMANGARNTTETGDLCWRNENATLSMEGHAGELIKEPAPSKRWRLRNDDGTRVEFRDGAEGVDNGARNGAHWIVTTPDGAQRWFGRSRQSVLNVQVAGNHAGEPCEAAAFKDSFCSQPYRWNLEYVVDLHGNTMSYSYDKETNKYARNNTTTDPVEYDRASVLRQIDYGTRSDRSETAPMQVVFEPADRCLADCGTKDAVHWPDVPWDRACDASPCLTGSPTFWSTKRLASVTTKVGGNPVEKWTLGHSFPDPGDGTRAGLWLDKISRVGLVGQQTAVPDIRFQGEQRSNRVDTHSDQHAAMKWWRLKTIYTETGGQIDITYSGADCLPGARMPDEKALQNNTLRCYPVRWKPEGNKDSIWDYFHKYVVNSVTESDLTGGSTRVVTSYEYVGNAAWHYTDDDGLIKAEDKTWSVWRGYGTVKTRKGESGEQTLTEKRYFRGMHGDKLPSGTRTVPMPAIAVGNIPETNDEDAFAGTVREEIVYNGPTGAEVSATVTVPWQSEPTASRTIGDVTTYARYTSTASKHSRIALDSGRGFRTTSVVTEFDQTYGTETQTEDRGDDAVAGDEKCRLTDYARNTSAWLIGTVSRKREFLVNCAKAKAGVGLQDAHIAGDTRTYYDGQGHGVAPTKSDVTRTESLKSYVNGAAAHLAETVTEYDVYGRVTKLTDPRETTTTAYTPAAGGPVTETATTNALGWVTKTVQQPAWGTPSSTVDENQRKTLIEYDGLGRTTAVWKPRLSNDGRPADKKFSYLERTNGPAVVATSVWIGGQYVTSRELFDGLLRPRQTQRPDATGDTSKTVVADTYYDSAGRAVRSNNAYVANAMSGPELFVPTDAVPSATLTTFDGAGREIAQVFKKLVPVGSPGGEELFRTTTYHAGDRTDVTPPAGGVVTSTLVDVLGRKSELRQYHSGVVAGSATGFDATKYSYDLKGQLTEVTHPSGKKWQYAYDVRGRQVRAVDPDKGVTESTYDDADQLVSTKDGRGKSLAYTYDALRRKTSTRDDSATRPVRAEWFYDVLADGTRINGALVKSVRHGELGAYIKEHTGMRLDQQPTATTITIPANETGLAGTYNYGYTYNPDDLPSSTEIAATGDLKKETLFYGYDTLGQPTTQKTGYSTQLKTDLITSTSYTPFGELQTYQMRNSTSGTVDVLRDYDEHTRRLSQIHTSKQTGPSDVANVLYGYDSAGNITRVADSVSSDTQCFGTDHLRRLIEAWTPTSGNCREPRSVEALGGPSKYWHTYSYNVAGDRTKLIEHGTSAGDRTTQYFPTAGKHSLASTVTADTGGTRKASYTYDEVGNTLTRPSPGSATQTMTWDLEGRVATTVDESGASSYVYDADGHRLIKRDPTGRTLYLPGQELRYTASSGAKTCTRYYTHAGQPIGTRTSTGITWMSADQQGTTQITINALSQKVSTRRTLPFGEVRGGTGTWPAFMDKGLVGGTVDNTGLTHIGAREYDPAIGRFISVDPIMDTTDPQQWNGYAYANNSPVTFSDPTGLLAMGCMDDGPCGSQGVRESYTPAAPTEASDAPGGESPRQKFTRENSPRTNDSNQLISIWSSRYMSALYGWQFWDNGMGDGEYACFGRMACQMAWIHLSKNPDDISGAKDIAANYCRDNWSACANSQFWEETANDFLGMAAGGVTGAAAAASRIRSACGPHSFTGDTQVLMADGTTKRIDEIKVGDLVLAAEPESAESGPREVVATIVGEGVKRLVEIEIGQGKIIATDPHPFWLPDQKRWTEAKDLHAGSLLQTPTGSWVQVTAIKKRIAVQRVYNLTIDGIHTYHVGASVTAVLVHNCPTPAIRISPAASDWATKGAHMHVGSAEVRVFPTDKGGVGFEGLRMRNGMASARDVEAARTAIMARPDLRADLISKARSAMADMNGHNWGNSLNRASEMNYLIKALEKIG